MTEDAEPAKKHAGGRFPRGVSGNPGGKKKQPLVPAEPSQPESVQPEKIGRNQDGTFAKGVSPNPHGRPKGARNRSTMAALAIMEADAEGISKRAVELALAGDLTAIRLVLERLVSPARDRPVQIEIPRMSAASDLVAASDAIAAAVADASLTPSEGAAISTLVANTAKAIEVAQIDEQLKAVEAALAGRN